jgi:hypothetical protein
MQDDKDLAERAAKERVTELFRSAGGLRTIEKLALTLCGAPPEKIEHDIAAFSRGLEVSFARRQDWPSSEFVDFRGRSALRMARTSGPQDTAPREWVRSIVRPPITSERRGMSGVDGHAPSSYTAAWPSATPVQQ